MKTSRFPSRDCITTDEFVILGLSLHCNDSLNFGRDDLLVFDSVG